MKQTGKASSARIPYLNKSRVYQNRFRVLRTPGHEMMPDFLGQWLPRRDDPQATKFYSASVLLLLKPWREVIHFLDENSTWEDSLKLFLTKAAPSEIQMLDNFQFYYACENSATKKRESPKSHYIAEEDDENLLREDEFVNEDRMETTIDVDQVAKEVVPTREILHGRHAVNIGVQTGIFSDNDQWSVESNDTSVADGKLMDRNVEWQSTVKGYSVQLDRWNPV
ncbi:hypothetical protein JB92DRAFT_2827947 [Gautieria morchelliformis]|nr:hypothetical protein JB92DRAFT_2827947 [Gautieria morchelliformis]